MGHYNDPASLFAALEGMERRLQALERTPRNPVSEFTSSARPDPTTVPSLIIRNTSTGILEYSDGTDWVAVSGTVSP